MKVLIINGTDINHRASGSGVVLKQFLLSIPSEFDVKLLNLGECANNLGVSSFNIKPQKIAWLKRKLLPIFTNTSLMYSRYLRDVNVVNKIRELHKAYHFDLIYYHDTIAMQHFEDITNVKQYAHLIDLHSSSYTYYIESSKSIFKKMYYKRERWACRKEESQLSQMYEKLFLVNKNEAQLANKEHSTSNFVGINLGVDLNTTLVKYTRPASKTNFVYLGNLNYKANYDGLINFINNYFKLLEAPQEYNLHIIGPGSETVKSLGANIKAYGFVDDLSELMSTMDFGIATMVNGSGLKNKVFDYLKYGLPVIINEYTERTNSINSSFIYVAKDNIDLISIVKNKKTEDKESVRESVRDYDQNRVCCDFWDELKGSIK